MNLDKTQNKITEEKQIEINNLDVNYQKLGNGKFSIVLLHGWGIDSKKYLPLYESFLKNKNYSVFIPDMPGFGKSGEPKEDWSLDNYVDVVNEFVEKIFQQNLSLSSSNLIIIGHSFGGRIAIKYVVKYPEKVCKLILTGAAGIKHNLTAKQKIFFILAKIGKILFSLPVISYLQKSAQKFLYRAARVKDYHHASPRMKKVMKNILAEDLTLYLEKVNLATLLVWGKLDRTTPLSDGKIMNQKIKNSKLVIVEDANHSLPYQKPEEFIKIIFEFLN